MKNLLIKLFALTLCFGFFSCEEDFLNIESDVNATQNFKITTKEFPVTAYSKKTGPVQANGLPTNYLGILKDETYNDIKTVSNLITEIVPTTFSPDFGENPEIQSISIYIPYFSSLISTDTNGDSTYDLSGFNGDLDESFELSILKSNYLLRDLDPSTNFEDSQVYYTDFYTTTLEAQDDNYLELYRNDNYQISSAELKVFRRDDMGVIIDSETERLAPGFRQELFFEAGVGGIDNRDFWNDIMGIVDDGTGSGETIQLDRDYLSNANNFKEFFRGIIIKVKEKSTDPLIKGSFVALNLGDNLAGITLEYTNNANTDKNNPLVYRFGYNGINVNTHTNSQPITEPSGNTVDGDDNLYLRGFEGAFTVVDLFGTEDLDANGLADAFEEFQENKGKWLINEANITFKVDNALTLGDEPSRVLLYDLKNNQPVVDYFFDQTSDADPALSRVTFSEPLTTDASGNGVQYKLRITEHLNNLLIRDSTNVKLGLFVSNNVNDLGFIKLKNPITVGSGDNETFIEEIPQQSVVSSKGTILHGTSSSVPETSEVKFEIYYTEEN